MFNLLKGFEKSSYNVTINCKYLPFQKVGQKNQKKRVFYKNSSKGVLFIEKNVVFEIFFLPRMYGGVFFEKIGKFHNLCHVFLNKNSYQK